MDMKYDLVFELINKKLFGFKPKREDMGIWSDRMISEMLKGFLPKRTENGDISFKIEEETDDYTVYSVELTRDITINIKQINDSDETNIKIIYENDDIFINIQFTSDNDLKIILQANICSKDGLIIAKEDIRIFRSIKRLWYVIRPNEYFLNYYDNSAKKYIKESNPELDPSSFVDKDYPEYIGLKPDFEYTNKEKLDHIIGTSQKSLNSTIESDYILKVINEIKKKKKMDILFREKTKRNVK